ncbi:MAG: aromatic aminobenezylarsenical efflux permease ArsG family transporter [Planctomycetota bacterium]
MDGFVLAAASAFWLGLLTAISPCPMATNIAAISFVGRRVGSPRKVLLSGLLYTAGRSLAYLGIAALLVSGVLLKAEVAAALQKYLNKVLGPLLILVGMVLVDLIRVSFTTFAPGERSRRMVEALGVWGAAPLGILFALSFCPISAGYFFALLIPLATQHGSRVLLPSLFGAGTALPVMAVAFVLAVSARSVSAVYNRLKQVEWWARRITGVVFILVGVYLSLVYLFGLFQ